ncbi:hypothetical protein WJX72_010527 [[Myrmecia] bisecta]|uniref:Uncharacterized protein n=1 Tax=[Myrmecia] bisecta TaxID=41462 RepID=A0AAW1P1U4_9CHLO
MWRTCASAVESGHLHIVQWAAQHGCPWDAHTCTVAARCDQVLLLAKGTELLLWAYEAGAPLCEGVYHHPFWPEVAAVIADRQQECRICFAKAAFLSHGTLRMPARSHARHLRLMAGVPVDVVLAIADLVG